MKNKKWIHFKSTALPSGDIYRIDKKDNLYRAYRMRKIGGMSENVQYDTRVRVLDSYFRVCKTIDDEQLSGMNPWVTKEFASWYKHTANSQSKYTDFRKKE